jgi:hypothetical protein
MIAPQAQLTMRASLAPRPCSQNTTNARSQPSRGTLQVVGAATKAKKNRDLERLRDLASAEETFLVAGFNYKGLTVRTILSLARSHRVARMNARGRVSMTTFAMTPTSSWVIVFDNFRRAFPARRRR